MRVLSKLGVAGASAVMALTFVVGPTAAHASTPAEGLRRCLRSQATSTTDADACVAAYLVQVTANADVPGDSSGDSLNTAILGTASDGGVNTGILGTATDGGVNTGILGTADGDGSVNTAVLGSAT